MIGLSEAQQELNIIPHRHPGLVLGSIRRDLQIQRPPQHLGADVGSVVRMDAERCARHRYHVVCDARDRLLWSIAAVARYRPDAVFQQI